MFYSPTKQFIKFSSYRTAEIKALKQRIQKEKITPDQITQTQMRLMKLKQQYDSLQGENNQQLKEVYQNSENAITSLFQEKQSMQKQALLKARQISDLECIRQQLQEKGSLIEEQLRSEIHEKEQLISMKEKNEEAVLVMEKQLDSLTNEASKRWGIQEEVRKAERDLSEKWECQRKIAEECKREKQEILSKIMQEKEEVAKQQRQWDVCEKQIQKIQISKQKSKVSEQWLKSRLETLSILKSKKSQTEWMLLAEKQTSSGLTQLLMSITDQTLRIEKEEIGCQKTIKETLIRLTQQEEEKCKLQDKISVAKANLRLLKQKNENLKNKMNSIFKSDCELIKTISNKKVYPNCKAEVVDIVKKSSAQPFASKQNLVLPLTKAQKIQFAVSPRNLTQNRIL